MEGLSASGHHSADESDKYVGSSSATTVIRKATIRKGQRGVSNSSDGATNKTQLDQNQQVLLNEHTNETNEQIMSIKQSSIVNPLNYGCLNTHTNNNSFNVQQILSTSDDTEAMTMRQFRMSSIGC